MYCPNCGKENSTNQKFCRACGLNLERTADALLEQMPDGKGFTHTQISKTFEIIGKIGMGGLVGGGAVAVVLLIWLVFKKMIESGQTDKIIFGLFLIAIIIFAVLSLAYVIYQEYLKDIAKKGNPVMQPQFEKVNTAKLLQEKPFEPIPSVTENTTNLLFTELKTKTSGELK